jgi:hypothetical protein
MAQNATMSVWTREEVDQRLQVSVRGSLWVWVWVLWCGCGSWQMLV